VIWDLIKQKIVPFSEFIRDSIPDGSTLNEQDLSRWCTESARMIVKNGISSRFKRQTISTHESLAAFQFSHVAQPQSPDKVAVGGPVNDIVFSNSDNLLLVGTTEHGIRALHLETLEDARSFDDTGGKILKIACDSQRGSVVSIRSSGMLNSYPISRADQKHEQAVSKSKITAAALSQDGSLLAIVVNESSVEIRSVQGHESRFLKCGQPIKTLAFSPDNDRLAAGLWHQGIQIWPSPSSGDYIELNGDSRGTDAIAFSCDGGLLAAGNVDKTIGIWDCRDWSQTSICRRHDDEITALVARSQRCMTKGRVFGMSAKSYELMGQWPTRTSTTVSWLLLLERWATRYVVATL
jgi:WD40 repeat protein